MNRFCPFSRLQLPDWIWNSGQTSCRGSLKHRGLDLRHVRSSSTFFQVPTRWALTVNAWFISAYPPVILSYWSCKGLREAIQGSINLSRNSTGAFIYCMSSKSLSPDRQIFTVGSTVLPNNFMVNTCIFTYLGPQSRCSIPWLTGDRTLNNGYVFARILIFWGKDKYKNERVQHPTLRQHPHPYYYPSTTRFINRTFLCTWLSSPPHLRLLLILTPPLSSRL